ncbi:uncharacterized protein LOC131658985 [Vicia villosa]|uniref:uncharacterized protein LOC131658985 n=1 Tax=Vicia villosa TaxID=3911 RepID=UPI00273B66BB|nr:uncharacterized protein LOC131658985 [Vicia villosa]
MKVACVGPSFSRDAVEVSISPRKNNRGRRFGFARFAGVQDGRLFAVRLDNIQIAGGKIHANLPRFIRGKVGGVTGSFGVVARNSGVRGGVLKGGNEVGEGSGRVGWNASRGSRSFATVVKGGLAVDVDVAETNPTLCFNSKTVVKERLRKAYVGRVLIPGSAFNIQTYIEMEGVFAVRVTPMGGGTCLLEDREPGFIDALIAEGETWWQSWFSEIKKWEENMVDGSREVWLRIYGIPVHGWNPEFFIALAEVWRIFICVDERTSKGEAYDVARIRVKIKLSSKIPESVTVNIDNKSFILLVREDVVVVHSNNNEKPQINEHESSSTSSDGNWQDDNGGDDILFETGDSSDPIRQFSEPEDLDKALFPEQLDKASRVAASGGVADEGFSQKVSSAPILAEVIMGSHPAGNFTGEGSFDEAISQFRAESSVQVVAQTDAGREETEGLVASLAAVNCSPAVAVSVSNKKLRSKKVKMRSVNRVSSAGKGGGNTLCCGGGRKAEKKENSSGKGLKTGSFLVNYKSGLGSLEGSQCSVFYGEHMEESDIVRSNGRQWKFLKNDFDGNMWDAIAALGVVDVEGRGKKLCLKNVNIEDENGEGRKEFSKRTS